VLDDRVPAYPRIRRTQMTTKNVYYVWRQKDGDWICSSDPLPYRAAHKLAKVFAEAELNIIWKVAKEKPQIPESASPILKRQEPFRSLPLAVIETWFTNLEIKVAKPVKEPPDNMVLHTLLLKNGERYRVGLTLERSARYQIAIGMVIELEPLAIEPGEQPIEQHVIASWGAAVLYGSMREAVASLTGRFGAAEYLPILSFSGPSFIYTFEDITHAATTTTN
jgi:hypothetical protein